MAMTIRNLPRLKGKLQTPGDKSITHRALLFAPLCKGECEISGAALNEDCQATIRCLQDLGLECTVAESESPIVQIKSAGLGKLRAPQHTLNVGNSGTTMRLLAGLLAGTNISCVIDGDESIRQRPMERIFEPLSLMGAKFICLDKPGCAPFRLQGAQLHSIDYASPVASAQVETAFVLAALQAQGRSTISLPGQVRDHTARLLRYMNIPIETYNSSVSVAGLAQLVDSIAPYKIKIPGDLSSAAFFMVAAALLPGSDIVLTGVGINPGRRLIIDIMLAMGADITIRNNRDYGYEPVADVHVKYSAELKAATISGAQVALGIDEIPALALLGCFCTGGFCVEDAAELRYKESNRLQSIVDNLRAAGVDVVQQDDGFKIDKLNTCGLPGGSSWITHGDHRMAMTGIIAGLVSNKPIAVDDTECIKVSYPCFGDELQRLLH